MAQPSVSTGNGLHSAPMRDAIDTVIVSSRLIDALRLASVQQLCVAHGVKLFRFHIELQTLADSQPPAESGDPEESPPQILQA